MPEGFDAQKQPYPKAEEVFESVKAAIAALRFGAINLTIHEGRVVQLDVTERRRFQA